MSGDIFLIIEHVELYLKGIETQKRSCLLPFLRYSRALPERN